MTASVRPLWRAAKYGGLSGLGLLVVLWAFSMWRCPCYEGSRVTLDVSRGAFGVLGHNAWAGVGWVLYYPEMPGTEWMPTVDLHRRTPIRWAVTVPLWMLAVPAGLLGIAGAWKLRQRRGPDSCVCGYDLTGLAPAAACPECGTPRPPSPQA